MTNMSEAQSMKCHSIIHSSASACAAIGISPIPGSDIFPIIAIQTAMIISLGKIFNLSINESYAESLAKTAIAGNLGKMFAGQLVKIFPGIGLGANAIVAFSITEIIGWDTAKYFYQQSVESTSTDAA